MLKITVRGSADRVLLELEGRLAGAWVRELEDCWRTTTEALGGRELWIDLTRADGVDISGRYLLALMHQSGARFLACGSVMPALIQEIEGAWPVRARPA